MTPELLASTAAVILSLMFSYAPGFSGWYGELDGIYKRLVMLGLLAMTSLGALVITCAGLGESFHILAACDQAGAADLLRIFLAAVVANQATYTISPRPTSGRDGDPSPDPHGYGHYDRHGKRADWRRVTEKFAGTSHKHQKESKPRPGRKQRSKPAPHPDIRHRDLDDIKIRPESDVGPDVGRPPRSTRHRSSSAHSDQGECPQESDVESSPRG